MFHVMALQRPDGMVSLFFFPMTVTVGTGTNPKVALHSASSRTLEYGSSYSTC